MAVCMKTGTETTEEMQRLSGIKEGLETLSQPPAARPGTAGDAAHAEVVRCDQKVIEKGRFCSTTAVFCPGWFVCAGG